MKIRDKRKEKEEEFAIWITHPATTSPGPIFF